MRRVKWTILLCGLVALCCSSTQLSAAQVVTSGYICCLNPGNLFEGAFFQLTGPGFDVTGSFENPAGGSSWGVGYCYACSPDTLLGVFGLTGGDNFNGGTATIGSNYFPSVGWYQDGPPPLGSVFVVSGPPILLTGPGAFRGTFNFTGELCGTFTGTDPFCGVDLPNLTGSGVVTVDVDTFLGINGLPVLIVTNAGYAFAPEPASLLLFGSGVLGLGGMVRRKLRA